jgi:hypothetical protein
MSVQFLVGERQALTWQAGLVGLLLEQFFHRVEWGDLDSFEGARLAERWDPGECSNGLTCVWIRGPGSPGACGSDWPPPEGLRIYGLVQLLDGEWGGAAKRGSRRRDFSPPRGRSKIIPDRRQRRRVGPRWPDLTPAEY